MEKKNFGLSPEGFQQLLQELKEGKDELYQQVFLNHFNDCMNYLKKQYYATHEDAYDASMDTLLAFCDRMKKGRIKYGNLRFLFTQMAGQVYLKSQKQANRTTALPEELNIPDEMETGLSTAAYEAFDLAWPKLGKECRQLLKSVFYDREKLKNLAKNYNKSEVAMRKQKQRCMTKLQAIFKGHYKQ